MFTKNDTKVKQIQRKMPKLSKRKRQLQNLFARNLRRGIAGAEAEDGADVSLGDGDEQDGDEETSDEEKEEEVANISKPVVAAKAAPAVTTASIGRSARLAQKSANNQAAVAAAGAASSSSSSSSSAASSSQNKNGNDERVWVQCNTCDKWRSLPSTVDPDKLPDIWTCDLNTFDPSRRSCEAPEESYKLPLEEQNGPLKSFLKVWSKRLKCADRAETRLSSAALTRGKKRKGDAEWIKCSAPSCGKWRAVPRCIETASLLRRLNKNKFYGGEGVWYCSMNSWDETTASCSAPQEPLWNCKWNLSSSR